MTTAFEEDRLPWLEAVDDEDGPRPLPAKKMLAAVAMVALAAALVAGASFWAGRSNGPAANGAPELIAAPDTPYKVRPEQPGGLDVAGESSTAYATSAGEDRDAALDLDNQSAAAPIARPADAEPAPEPAAAAPPKPAPAKPPAPTPVPAPSGGGSVIQLGAYASTAKAATAWKMLASRFPAVGALSQQVESASVGGKTVYRLRATGAAGATREACAALTAAGENCLVVK